MNASSIRNETHEGTHIGLEIYIFSMEEITALKLSLVAVPRVSKSVSTKSFIRSVTFQQVLMNTVVIYPLDLF